jgi:hypothetical protein
VVDDIQSDIFGDNRIDVSLVFFLAVFDIVGLELVVLEFDEKPDVWLALFGD